MLIKIQLGQCGCVLLVNTALEDSIKQISWAVDT